MDTNAINLVRGRKPHFFDHFIDWALTVGRSLVILTEMVALGAFLYRFGLDRQLVDLHDKIVQQQNIVNFLKETEGSYRNLQNRLTLAKSIEANTNQSVKAYLDITKFIPEGMTLETIIFSQKDVKINVSIYTIDTLTPFVTSLKSYPQVSSVSIDNIANKTTTGTIDVSITATLQKGKTAPI